MFSRKTPCDRKLVESIAIIGYGERDISIKTENKDNSALETLLVFPPSHEDDYYPLIYDV